MGVVVLHLVLLFFAQETQFLSFFFFFFNQQGILNQNPRLCKIFIFIFSSSSCWTQSRRLGPSQINSVSHFLSPYYWQWHQLTKINNFCSCCFLSSFLFLFFFFLKGVCLLINEFLKKNHAVYLTFIRDIMSPKLSKSDSFRFMSDSFRFIVLRFSMPP